MGLTKFFVRYRRFFLREGFLYVLVLAVAFICVDVSAVVQSVKIRKLNDVAVGINMSQLDAFSKGEIPASAVDWKKLIAYFRLIMKLFPAQEDAEMFLGYCEYYGLGDEITAFKHIGRSAGNMPYFFWNLYDSGIFLFKHGDMEHAVLYFEMTMLLPVQKVVITMGNSILYRQFFAKSENQELLVRVNHGREIVTLLLAAGHYYRRDYEMAKIFAMKGVAQPGINNREPFYFYAGAIAMAQGHDDEALSFFDQAVKAKSKNPLVYLDAADILNKKGRVKEAEKMSQIGKGLQQGNGLDQFPYPEYFQVKLL